MPIGRLNNFNDLEWSRRVNSDNNPSPTSLWETTLRNGSNSNDDDYNNTVIAWPPQLGGLGETARLQNYVLFDIYDTGGERLDATRGEKSFVNFDELGEFIGNPLDQIKIGDNEPAAGGGDSSSETGTAAGIGAILALLITQNLGGAVTGSLFATTIQRFGAQFVNVSENVNFDFEDENNKNNLIEGKLLESFNSTALGLSNRTKRIGLSIALPMPAQLNSNYGLEYADTDFNTMSSVLSSLRLYNQSGENKEQSPLGEELGRKLATVGFSAIDSLSSILKSEGLNTKEFSEQFLRQAPNRFSEKTFKGVERRKFEMSFSVSPRSVEEAKIITSIIYAFKKFSHPKLTKGGLYLDYPAQFRIGFYNKTEENDFLYKMGLCACTRVSVTYGKDMLGFLREIREGIPGDTDSSVSGAPANSMEILLSFEELELLTRQRIEAGY